MADRTGDGISVATDDALLAAVHDEVIDYGVRRATATSIAKRAGVSSHDGLPSRGRREATRPRRVVP